MEWMWQFDEALKYLNIMEWMWQFDEALEQLDCQQFGNKYY